MDKDFQRYILTQLATLRFVVSHMLANQMRDNPEQIAKQLIGRLPDEPQFADVKDQILSIVHEATNLARTRYGGSS